tara:strand:- start:11414 stop:12163 length:750 start_codon:yes stop_codon:yes gene_type:complete
MIIDQKKSNNFYAKLSKEKAGSTESAGRRAEDEGIEPRIFEDILSKLEITEGQSILDIGCGCGPITNMLLDFSKENKSSLHLIDVPEVIENIDTKGFDCKLTSGVFPEVLGTQTEEKYDVIIVYSVLHYVEDPALFIESCVRLLKSQGRLLIGDIPNVNKKGRFLASEFGHIFDSNYKKVDPDSLPRYKDHNDFVEKNKDSLNMKLSDSFLISQIEKYRQEGFNAFIVQQNKALPFSFTREDLIIEALS